MKRLPQQEINVGDEVLVNTNILSKAFQRLTSKFVPRRDGPYLVIERIGSSFYVVAAKEKKIHQRH